MEKYILLGRRHLKKSRVLTRMVAEIPGFCNGHSFRKRNGHFGGQCLQNSGFSKILKLFQNADSKFQNSRIWIKYGYSGRCTHSGCMCYYSADRQRDKSNSPPSLLSVIGPNYYLRNLPTRKMERGLLPFTMAILLLSRMTVSTDSQKLSIYSNFKLYFQE